jgi:D-amino-acid oxidase
MRWEARGLERLRALVAVPEAGIDMLDAYECDDDEGVPWWAAGLDMSRVRAPVIGAPWAWRFDTPRIEPARYLAWLSTRLPDFHIARVDDLDALDGDAIVNCTGLGARALVGDPTVAPLRGQVVVVDGGDIPRGITFTDDRAPGPIFYTIPRRDCVVLGGTSDDIEDVTPDPAITARILAQCRALGWSPGAVIRERVGLRPYRPEVRLERDPTHARVIHCYGHGGAGYTLAHGCAEDVVDLIGHVV